MSDEIKISDVHQAVKTLDKAFEDVKGNSAALSERIDKIEEAKGAGANEAMQAIDKFDKKNQELTLKLEAQEKEAAEAKERLASLEEKLIKGVKSGAIDYKETDEYKALNDFVKKGFDITTEQKAYLRTDVNTQGGFLLTPEMASEVTKKVQEISPVRALARIRNTQTKTLEIPVRNDIPLGYYEGEAEEADEQTADYQLETMTASAQHVATPITRDLLNFANFDMMAEMADDAATGFAKREGNRFLLGTGVKQPQGILDSTAGVSQIDTAAVGTLTLDDVIQLAGELKEGYNPVYAFNRKTLYTLRTEKDSNGNYLWRVGGETLPSEINGYRYVIMQDLPDIATSATPVLFGDFFRGYSILDAVSMELVRDDVTLAKKRMVLMNWFRWNDGRVVLSEAFKLLKVKA